MNYDEYGWRKFLTEAREPAKKPKMHTERKLLRELDEDEFSIIQDAIDEMGPEDLAFNDLFEGKTRLIIDFKAFDETSDMGKFARTLRDQGYTVDWEKGMVYAEREVSTKSATDDIMAAITGARTEKKKKKIQMKIGKLFGKIANVAQRQNELLAIIQKKADRTLRHPGNVTGNEAADALNAEQLENWERLHKQMTLYIPNPGLMDGGYAARNSGLMAGGNTAAEMAVDFGNFWRDNAEYIKKNMDKLFSDRYSIIITRDPVDILRMSDFQRITSCHSPPSREVHSQSEFKCAVAEAHGEGAVAYVVRNEDLYNLLNDYDEEEAKDLQGLLDFYQSEDKEFFADPERGEGDIKPISRLRLKQYRSPVAEVGLAVPEERVYGRKFPSYKKAVIQWAKDTQAKEIEKIEATKNSENPEENLFDDDALDLRKWERYGGTYQDTPDSTLFYNLLGYTTVGSARIDSSTEDNLSLNSSVIDQWEQEVNATQERYNNHMQSIQVEASVEDDGAGEAYIGVHAEFKLRIPESEFVYSAFNDETRNAILEIPSTLNDYGYNWLDDSIQYTVDEGNVVMTIPVDLEDVNPEGSGYAYSPDNFEEICRALDQKDDMADSVEENAKSVLKRYGVLHGGELIKLARVLDEESWYEWDYEVDDDWDPTHIELNTSLYVNFNELIAQIPVKFSTGLKVPTQDFVAEYDGSLIAVIETWEKELPGTLPRFRRAYRVRSEEFEDQTGVEVGSKEEALRYIQWEIARLILNAGPYKQGPLIRASRDYAVAVRMLMRDAAGGKEGEFSYPTSRMMVSRPDADDEFQMRFIMELDDDDPDEVVMNAHQIILETDDEETQRDIFLRAFAKAAKLPGASVNETRKYFNKFNIF